MITLLVILFLTAAFTVFPVMIAAKAVGARNTGFGSALLALILQSVVSVLISRLVFNVFLAGLISLLACPAVYAMVLGTTYWRGLAVSVLYVLLVAVALFLIAPFFLGHPVPITGEVI